MLGSSLCVRIGCIYLRFLVDSAPGTLDGYEILDSHFYSEPMEVDGGIPDVVHGARTGFDSLYLNSRGTAYTFFFSRFGFRQGREIKYLITSRVDENAYVQGKE